MTTDTLHPLAAEYLKRLRRAGRGLPPGPMRELLAEIEGHLSEAIDPSASDAQALTALDKLGEPEAIIAAETPRPDELPAVAEPSTPVCRNRRSGGGLRSLMLVRSWGLSVSAGRGRDDRGSWSASRGSRRR
jgi:hypothetical protein